MWDARSQAETDGNFMCETIAGENMAREPLRYLGEGERRLEGRGARAFAPGSDSAEDNQKRSKGGPRKLEELFGEEVSEEGPEEATAAAVDDNSPERISLSQNVTEWNLDTLCQSNSKYLYADDEAKSAVDDYFRENCFQKETCRLDLDNIGGRRFRDLVSPFCRRRVLGDPEAETEALQRAPVLDTNQLLYVVGCQSSTYHIQGLSMHK